MSPVDIRLIKVLDEFKSGKISVSEAEARINSLSMPSGTPTDSAIIDDAREKRTGFPEAIYAQSKTPEQVVEIFSKMIAVNGKALATRCSDETLSLLQEKIANVNIHKQSKMAWLLSDIEAYAGASVAVLTAGTSDLPVAEEAAITLEFAGCLVDRIFDVGVAGIHRLLSRMSSIEKAGVIIVIAGMEGALPSVVGGLFSKPIIAVPTSVGYGASFQGISALLGMLNSCSSGISVVNIDNGFGAAVAAIRIIKGLKESRL